MNKKIAVLLGGISAEKKVSLETGKYVSTSLEKQGYKVKKIKVTNNKKNLNQILFLMHYMEHLEKMDRFKDYLKN